MLSIILNRNIHCGVFVVRCHSVIHVEHIYIRKAASIVSPAIDMSMPGPVAPAPDAGTVDAVGVAEGEVLFVLEALN